MDTDEMMEVGEWVAALIDLGETTEGRLSPEHQEAYSLYMNQ